MAKKEGTPPETIELPEVTNEVPEIPSPETAEVALPEPGDDDNKIAIGDTTIEIKPTKVRYQRDRTASFYKALEMYPLTHILSAEKGFFDTSRNGDKCVMDWLIAVTDNPKLIIDHYNDMDTETIEKLLVLFKKVNRIEEKEEKLKNFQKEREEAKKE